MKKLKGIIITIVSVGLVALICFAFGNANNWFTKQSLMSEYSAISDNDNTLKDGVVTEIKTEFKKNTTLPLYDVVKVKNFDSTKVYRKIGKFNIPLTARQLSFDYSMTVHGGIKDLSKADAYQKDENTIVIKLPQPEILNDETERGVRTNIKEQEGLFNSISDQEVADIETELTVAMLEENQDEVIEMSKKYTLQKLDSIIGKFTKGYHVEIEWV